MNQLTGRRLSLAELQDPHLRSVYDYWCLKKGDRTFPSRKDIRPEEMKRYLSNLMLIDVSHEPLDFVYRVFGTAIATAHGKEFTRKSVSQLEPVEFANLVWHQYLDAVNERVPCLHCVTFASDERHEKYQRLTMPLSSDGRIIDKLLAVSVEDWRFWKAVADSKGTTSHPRALG